ncbi:MAG TPA: response regulator transcription factor [Acidimicrobiales bacterium]
MIRVLVVDDEPDICLLLKLQLDFLPGFEVVGTAADGADALEQCRALKPDAIVLDLLLPGTSGFEAIDNLQTELPHIGIVAYTGVAGDFVRDEMVRQRVQLVLKSGEIDPLAEAIREVVERS